MIRAEHLAAGYGPRTVVGVPRLALRPGSVTAVMGPGGSGKSTLLRALAGEVSGADGFWVTGRVAGVPPSKVVLPQPGRRSPPPGVFALPPHGTPASARLEALTSAIGGDAPLLCLDEPEAGLGPGGAERVAQLLVEARGRRTVVLVTHHLGLARAVSDRVLLVVDGRLVESAPAKTFFERPRTARARRFVQTGG